MDCALHVTYIFGRNYTVVSPAGNFMADLILTSQDGEGGSHPKRL
jgi:hypothetical protein